MEITPGLAFKTFVCATAAAGLLDLYMVQKLKAVSGRFASPRFTGANLRWVAASPLLRRLVGEATLEYLKPRSLGFPGFELAFGLMVLLALYSHGPGVGLVRATLLLAFVWPLAIISGQHFYEGGVVPDVITLTGVAAGLLTGFLQGWRGFFSALAGTVVGAGILLVLYLVWWWIRREEGLGLGTIKALAMVGAFSGRKGALVALFLAALGGSITALVLVARRNASFESKLPFAMYLALAGILAALWAEQITSWYMSLLVG